MDGSKVFADLNSNVAFNPASVIKIGTSFAALSKFGADRQFETAVYADGALNKKVRSLKGDLILMSDGDPNLNTPDIEIANKIARAIRFSSGGLRYAKAMGVDLKARKLAQVSINMTDFEQTPLHRVFEMVKREAERYGVMPVGSEVVGLIPKRAIEMTADFYLQLENFSPEQVLENRLSAALSGAPLETKGKLATLAQPFLDAVAAPTATPGGGSVAAYSAALAAGLGQMVAALSRKKKAQAQFVDQLSAAVDELRQAAAALAFRQEEVPQAGGPGLHLQFLDQGQRLPARAGAGVGGLLLVVALLVGEDVLVHEGHHAFAQGLGLRDVAQGDLAADPHARGVHRDEGLVEIEEGNAHLMGGQGQ